MSEPASPPCCNVAVPAPNRREHRSEMSPDTTEVCQNGRCEGSDEPPLAPATVLEARGGPMQVSHSEPDNAPGDCSPNLLRTLKHNPGVIVFCGHGNQVVSASEGSDARESSPSTAGEEVDRDGGGAFPEALQFKELQVSRRRRNLSRNRKVLRKRQDARPRSVPLDSRNPSSEGKSVFTGVQEQQDPPSNNGKQQVGERCRVPAFYQPCTDVSLKTSVPMPGFVH